MSALRVREGGSRAEAADEKGTHERKLCSGNKNSNKCHEKVNKGNRDSPVGKKSNKGEEENEEKWKRSHLHRPIVRGSKSIGNELAGDFPSIKG